MKLHYFAAGCSTLVTGLGQVVRGDSNKGVALLLLFYFVLPVIVYLSLILIPFFFPYILGFAIIFGIILWLYNIWDALARS